MPKTPMPFQEPCLRIQNFAEVSLGYDQELAKQEATRCLHCRHQPCVDGCPVHIVIPDFIQQVKEGEIEKAYAIIRKDSSLPAVCGRVCPQEKQCEARCVRGIKDEPVAIGRLERFVADHAQAYESKCAKPTGHSVGIIGSGPAGLACAMDLAVAGIEVTIYEALHTLGGVLMYGIPEFRLPKSLVQKEIANLTQLGVKVVTNFVVGRSETIEELLEHHDALFIGSGAGLPQFMGLAGENLKGVYSANEFLTRMNLMKAYDSQVDTPIQHPQVCVVVGGGNVAMDAARCAARLGSEVHIVYRRSLDELPARKEEVEHALEEGIHFDVLANPIEILGDEQGWIKAVRCIKMRLGEPDEGGRRRPIEQAGSEYDLPCDALIMAIGTRPNPLLARSTKGLKVNNRGSLVVDEQWMTSIPAVFAGGDAVTGSATVISAMGAGRQAALSIQTFLGM